MELVLIRHGLPEQVVSEDGSPADPPLSEEGHKQAGQLAEFLGDEQFDHIYASPMRRAYQTAQPLAEKQGVKIDIRSGIAEYDQQASVYIPIEQLKEVDYDRWNALMNGNYGSTIDFSAFADLVILTLEQIVGENPGKKIAVACHGGVINVWAAHVIGFEPRLFFNPNYTSINRFMAASSGQKSVITLNQAVHL